MTARDYLRVLREGWIIVTTCAVLATIGAAIVTLTEKPVYQATSALAVSTCVTAENSSACDPIAGMEFAVQRASIYSSTATSMPVLQRALELTDAVSQPSILKEHITVTQGPDSPVIDVTATWSDPTDAASIANALSEAIVEYAQESIDRFESGITTVDFSVISEATPPSGPISHVPRTIGLALVFGLLVGLALAFARYYFDTRLRDRADIEKHASMAVLASLPLRASADMAKPTLAADAATDAFRRLRAATAVRITDGAFQTLLVASPTDGSSASQVARGLANALSETGSRVAVVDLDFQQAERSRTPADGVGITDIMEGGASLDSVIDDSGSTGPIVIPAGLSTTNREMKLTSSRLSEVLSELRSRVDILLLSAAPVLSSADALSAASLSDGVLVVVELGASKREDLRETIRSLELVEARLIGVTSLTQVRRVGGGRHE